MVEPGSLLLASSFYIREHGRTMRFGRLVVADSDTWWMICRNHSSFMIDAHRDSVMPPLRFMTRRYRRLPSWNEAGGLGSQVMASDWGLLQACCDWCQCSATQPNGGHVHYTVQSTLTQHGVHPRVHGTRDWSPPSQLNAATTSSYVLNLVHVDWRV